MDTQNMTIPELKKYVNSLSNEEFAKFEEEFEHDEIDVVELLDAARLYDYMQYKHKSDITIEF